MTNLSIIIPAKNEPESLPSVLDQFKNLRNEVYVVLESEDKATINSIKGKKCNIIYQKKKGYGNAIIEGIYQTKTKYFCIFNADGSFEVSEIDLMLKKIETDNSDIVFGSRYEKNGFSEDDTIVTLLGNKIFTLIGKIFFSLKITDILYTFVLGKTEEVKNLSLNQKDFRFCVELPIKAMKKGYKLSTISSYEKKRIAGIKKVNAPKDGLLILSQMIYLYFR